MAIFARSQSVPLRETPTKWSRPVHVLASRGGLSSPTFKETIAFQKHSVALTRPIYSGVCSIMTGDCYDDISSVVMCLVLMIW